MNRYVPHQGLAKLGMSSAESWSAELRLNANASTLAGEGASVLVAGNEQSSLHEYGYRTGGPREPIGGTQKRALDLLVAGLALIPASIIMLIAIVLIKLTMGGPVFFKHKRIGFDGKPFFCYKFRTMVCNGSEVLAAHLHDNPDARREWEETRKLRNDPRVTFVGAMLRKSSMDELPQLFNVFKGEMSCVGPRPVVADELERYGSAASLYLKMRPGMTGLWQTSGRSCVDYERRVAFDVDYGQNWSLKRDVHILARTVVVITNFKEAA